VFNDPQNSLVWLHTGKKHVEPLAQDSKRSVWFAIKEAPVVKWEQCGAYRAWS